jgi:capsular exopolysaccharide synthesis family protein
MANDRAQELVTYRNPRSTIAEAYRSLRTNINFSRLDKNIRSLMVTSSGPQEGKSTTCSNLAVTMAQAGSSVLLVDADLRLPILHTFFSFNNQFGLTNALFDEENFEMYVRSTPVDNLGVLTSGPLPPNPSELLGSKRMANLLEIAKRKYEVVLSLVDGVILVIHAGGIEKDVVRACKQRLDAVKANILGVVLNKVDIDKEKYYYYYYSYYGNYYYYSDDRSQK